VGAGGGLGAAGAGVGVIAGAGEGAGTAAMGAASIGELAERTPFVSSAAIARLALATHRASAGRFSMAT
jgi:hypothetical protein